MAAIHVSEAHQHPVAEMVRRVNLLFTQITQEYGHMVSNFHSSWSANTATFSFTAHGMDISGTAHVTTSRLVIDGSAPFFAAGRVEELIQDLARRVIDAPLPAADLPVARATAQKPASARRNPHRSPAQQTNMPAPRPPMDTDPFGLIPFIAALVEALAEFLELGFNIFFGWMFEEETPVQRPGDTKAEVEEEFDLFKPLGDFLDKLFGD